MKKIKIIQDILCICNELGRDYSFIGDEKTELLGFSDPSEYNEHTAVWLGAIRFLKIPKEKYKDVALLFCSPSLLGKECFPNRIECEDPRNTFMEIVERIAGDKDEQHIIAETAIISPSAKIGKGVSIGHYTVIEDNVEIGDNTSIGHGTIIRDGTVIGANCIIEDNTVIGNGGFGFRNLSDGSYKRLPHLGRVVIGNNVEIGSNCNIDKGTFKDTIIGDGTKIDSTAFVEHNVEIGKNVMIVSGSIIGGNTKICDGAYLVGMRCKNRLTVGENSKVGIGSVVLFDVRKGTTVFGNPAKKITPPTID